MHAFVQASRSGIPVAFSGSSEQIRVSAALAVNAGMTPESAMLALTSGAARLLGMPAGSGEIEPGQPADLVVWNNTPLNLAARPEVVIIDGKEFEPDAVKQKLVPVSPSRLAGSGD